jgi:hypothetical protein
LKFMDATSSKIHSYPLEVREREGGLFVKSHSIPGFYLFNRDFIRLFEDIPMVAKLMLLEKYSNDFNVAFHYGNGPEPINKDQIWRFLMSQPPIWVRT